MYRWQGLGGHQAISTGTTRWACGLQRLLRALSWPPAWAVLALALLCGNAARAATVDAAAPFDKGEAPRQIAVPVGVLAQRGPLQQWPAGGQPEGLDLAVLQRLADASGLTLRFERFTEPQALWQALRSGQVRLVATSAELLDSATPLAFTQPYAQLAMAMLAGARATSVSAAPDLAGRRLASVQAEPHTGLVQQRFSLAQRSSHASLAEAAQAVARGDADFLPEAQVLLQPMVAADPRLRLIDLPGLPRLPRRWAALQQDAPLIARLDQALAATEPSALRALLRQYLDAPAAAAAAAASASTAPAGPAAPSAAAASAPGLRVGYPLADPPYSARNAVGLPDGLGLEVVQAILRRAGLKAAEWVPLASGDDEAALAAGRIDLLIGLPETADRRRRFSLVGPYQSSPLAIVSRERYSAVGLAALSGQRVAVPRSLAVQASLGRLYPGVQWVDCSDETQGLALVSRGAADALLGRLHGLPARLSAQDDAALRITGLADGLYDDGHLALPPDHAELAHALRGAMDQVLREDLPGIEQRWSLRRDDSAVDWLRVRKWVIAATVLVGALLAGWVAHYRQLRREEERTLAAHQRAERYLGFLANEVRTSLQAVVATLARWPVGGAGVASAELQPQAGPGAPVDPTDRAGQAAPPPEGLPTALAQSVTSTVGQLDGLIDQHRLKAGTLGLQRRPESPLAVVRESVDEWGLRAQARGHVLRFQPRDGVGGWWLLDAFRLQQVLRNVLAHALRDSRPGEVMVDLALQPSPRGSGWGHWVVAVRDRRPVLNAQAQARLFEVDDQGLTLPPDTLPRPAASRGLRLARDLAQAMGGTLVVEAATAGGGNGLILHLDLQAAAGPAEPAGAPLQRVLLAEGSPAYGLLLLQALAEQGVQAVVVPSVGAAGDRLAEAGGPSFGLVLCDSLLGDGGLADMLQLARERRLQGLPMPPVIGLGGDFDTADIERLSALGAADLITKDSDVADLVRRVLRSWGAASAAAPPNPTTTPLA